jgi:oligopeptide/dipeptide ABC transporter ATP-binding protein
MLGGKQTGRIAERGAMTAMPPSTGATNRSATAVGHAAAAADDAALERCHQSERRAKLAPDLVTIRNLKMHFPVAEGALIPRMIAHVKAVDGVSFTIRRGETFGLVGESGCGKTTTGRCILRLERPTGGEILFDGRNLIDLDRKSARALCQKIQVIFQDPYSSLNPRLKIGEIIAEPMRVHRTEPTRAACDARVAELLRLCGLDPKFADRYPHEMSGGQRQRVGIARALSVRPEFVICDEAISALDVSIQAQIINLLEDLRTQFGLTYLFIAHDLSVVRHLCHRVAVMYLGKIVELADCDELYSNPLHPYTQALLAAVPIPDPEIERKRGHKIVKGEVPSPINPPSGCVFHPRCPIAVGECAKRIPEFRELRPGHWVACSLI